MAHPKRRHSNARTRKRRTHDKLETPNLVKCGNCSALIFPHRVCRKCGFYKGTQIIKKKEKKNKKKQ